MTAAPSEPVLKVRGPADLICAVPYLLGFHPIDSLVIVGLERGSVVVTVRVDLDLAVGDPCAVDDAIDGMRRGGAARFIVLLFADDAVPLHDAEVLPWAGLAGNVVMSALETDAEIADAILVAGGRYWSYLCYGCGCCPAEGTPVGAAASEIPARATYAGMVALPDRAAVSRLLDPQPNDVREALAPAIDKVLDHAAGELVAGREEQLNRSDVRALFAAARRMHVADPEVAVMCELDEATVARFAVALRRIDVRDAVWTALDDGRLEGDELWRYLSRVLPEPYDAAPSFLVGWAAWRRGEGAIAQIAVERALGSDPGYSAADLLDAALAGAVDPRSMPKVRRRGRKYGRSHAGPG